MSVERIDRNKRIDGNLKALRIMKLHENSELSVNADEMICLSNFTGWHGLFDALLPLSASEVEADQHQKILQVLSPIEARMEWAKAYRLDHYVRKARQFCSERNYAKAWAFYCKIFDVIEGKNKSEVTNEAKVYLESAELASWLSLLSDNEIYAITDYGRKMSEVKYEICSSEA